MDFFKRFVGQINPIKFIAAYFKVGRFEYFGVGIPTLFFPLFLSISSGLDLIQPIVLMGCITFSLFYLSGFLINSLTDREIDCLYTSHKSNISRSVGVIGIRDLKLLIAGHVIIVLGLSSYLSYLRGNYWILITMLIATFFGLGYSARPFCFKVRGVMHTVSLALSAFFLPQIFIILVVTGKLNPLIFLMVVGFAFAHYSMEFGNQALDYLEDSNENIRTPPVRWGLAKSLKIALIGISIGIMIIMSSFYMLIPSSTPAYNTSYLIYLSVIFAIIILGYYTAFKGLWKMYFISINPDETLEVKVKQFKHICKYSRWQAIGKSGITIGAFLLFITTYLG